jgi:hypothetical protein
MEIVDVRVPTSDSLYLVQSLLEDRLMIIDNQMGVVPIIL